MWKDMKGRGRSNRTAWKFTWILTVTREWGFIHKVIKEQSVGREA